MTPELITRLKNACEKLAKDMPSKFEIIVLHRPQFQSEFLSFSLHGFDRLISIDDSLLIVEPDPKGECSNSIGRIVDVAFNERWFIVPTPDGFEVYCYAKDKLHTDSHRQLLRVYNFSKDKDDIEILLGSLCLRIAKWIQENVKE